MLRTGHRLEVTEGGIEVQLPSLESPDVLGFVQGESAARCGRQHFGRPRQTAWQGLHRRD